MTLEQQVTELSKLIDERESVIKVKEVAANMTSGFAEIKISTNVNIKIIDLLLNPCVFFFSFIMFCSCFS